MSSRHWRARSKRPSRSPCQSSPVETPPISAGFETTLARAVATWGRINELRLGESILLGREPLHRRLLEGLFNDAITLVAEVLESRAGRAVGCPSCVCAVVAGARRLRAGSRDHAETNGSQWLFPRVGAIRFQTLPRAWSSASATFHVSVTRLGETSKSSKTTGGKGR